MYSKLLWCGTSLLLNKLKPNHIDNTKDIILNVVKSEAKSSMYRYEVKLNDRSYTMEFSFHTNVCIYGTLCITDVETAQSTIFKVDRTTDITKCSISDSEYNEFYRCCDKCFINLTILDNKIVDIATVEMIRRSHSKTLFKLNHNVVAIQKDMEPNTTFIKTLFAATAALDYDTVICGNPVYIGTDDVNIVSFMSGTRRILCLTQPRGMFKSGNTIRLINSDFNQIIIHYTITGKHTSTIEEYVMGSYDKPILRRHYDCVCNCDLTEISDSSGHAFSINRGSDEIVFSKLNK